MDCISLKHITVPVSRIIYGTAIRAMTQGENADEILDWVTEQGITTFDTARSYGKSEAVLGDWVQRRGNRDRINILTKGCNPHQTKRKFTPASLREELEQSLKELQTPYVDFYALHRDDTETDVSVFIETLNAFKAEGKLRAFGGSNWTWQRMDAANEYAYAHNLEGFSFGSPAFSLAEVVGDPWGGSVHLSGESMAEARRWFRANHIPVFAYSPLARGFMSGKYRTDMTQDISQVLPSWTCEEYVCEENMERLRRAELLAAKKGASVGSVSLAWLLRQETFCCPICGSSSIGNLQEDLAAFELELSPAEMEWLDLKRDDCR